MYVTKMSQIALLAGVIALCPLFATGTSADSAPVRVSLTGWLTCTTCLEPNACKAQTRLECIRSGISHGASYVLVVDDKHYILSGLENELARAAEKNSVTITGDLTGNELSVASVDWTSKKRHE